MGRCRGAALGPGSRARVQELGIRLFAGPLNAGGFGPNDMDSTFGPEVVYYHGPDYANQSPLDEIQHFGEVDINAETAEMTVRLLTTRGTELFTQVLPAE